MIFFALVLVGFGVAAWSGAALAWDGSWYLWRTFSDDKPFIAHGRWTNWLTLRTILGMAQLQPGRLGPWGLARLDGILLALFPIGSLASCWLVFRGRWEPLRAWAAIGVLLAPLPGQWALMSEATLVAQLGWPLLALAGVSSGQKWTSRVSMMALSALMWGLHPSAAVWFALAAAMLFSRGSGWLASGFGGLTVARLVLAWWEATPYERGEVSVARIWVQWQASVWGLPVFILAGAGALAAILCGHLCERVSRRQATQSLIAVGGMTALAGVIWGLDPHRWCGALDFRRWVLPVEILLLGLAAWHGKRLTETSRQPLDGTVFRVAAGLAAGICCLTLASQSLAWSDLLRRFVQRVHAPVTERTPAWISAEEFPWLRGTALDHWTICPLGLWFSAGKPEPVFVLNETCLLKKGKAVQLTPWDRLEIPPRQRVNFSEDTHLP